jgi:hypothetical protein
MLGITQEIIGLYFCGNYNSRAGNTHLSAREKDDYVNWLY